MNIHDCFNQFLMLMYKSFLLRKRHYIVTTLEILLPILISSIPVIIISQLPPPGDIPNFNNRDRPSFVNYTTYKPFSPFEDDSFSSGNTNFFYTPKDKEAFFNASLEYWITKTSQSQRQRSKIIVEGFDSEAELEDAAMIQSIDDAVVGSVFDKVEGNKLHYKIRYRNYFSMDFHTDTAFQFTTGPKFSNTYQDSKFMSWQAAIEQTFIKTKNKDADFQVSMQRFPYPAYKNYSQGMPMEAFLMFFTYSFIIFFYIMLKRVVDEKANRSKELLKMMGMTDLNYWLSTFVNHFLVGLVIVLIAAIIYTAPMPNSWKLMTNTDFFLLFVVFILYLVSTILMALVTSILFNKVNLAIPFFMVIFIVPYSLIQNFYFPIGTNNTPYLTLSRSSLIGICLWPTGAIQIAFKMISILSTSGAGATWENLTSSLPIPGLNLAIVMAMMLLSCFIFVIIIWYLDAVWPWQFGVPKPLYFPFTKAYWFGDKQLYNENKEVLDINTDFFEPDPTGTTPGIVIRNLCKDFKVGFRSKPAVDNVSLNIYSGQITALLGRNGAGKTTTVNMLTGLFPPKSGSASISGWDIRTNMDDARKQLGICPQDNILFPTLTVEDHLKIIAGMKGVKWGEMAFETDRVLKLVNLTDKQKALAQGLSGGMKRKLSLALAIIGNSKVLFLDEPTSGLDPENRRNLWDILLNIRHDKTIILTTHYMEEADILGDRIAIMVNGKVKCCGSPMFLKQKFGTGYHLIIAREETCDISAITTLLKEFIPEVTLEDNNNKELKYSFGSNNSGDSFAKLFKALESQQWNLGVTSYGLSVTTIDDVFLKINTMDNDLDIKSDNHNGNGAVDIPEGEFLIPSEDKATGIHLWLNCILAIFTKRLYYAKRHYSILITQFFFPFAMLCAFLGILMSLFKIQGSPPSLKLDLKSIYGTTQAIYRPDDLSQTFFDKRYLPLLKENGVDTIHKENNMTQFLLDYGSSNLISYLQTFLIGANPTDSIYSGNFTTWYNGEPYHVLPISLNLIHNAILRNFTGDNVAEMIVTNAPLPKMSNTDFTNDLSSYLVRPLTAVFIPLALSYAASSYAAAAIQECSSRAKLLQLMSGVSAFTYWLGMFLWDMMVYTVFSILFIIPFAIFQRTTFFDYPNAIGSAMLLLILFGWSCIPMGYILSRWVKKPSTGYSVLMSFNFLVGMIATILLTQLDVMFPFNRDVLIAVFFLRVLPIFSVSWGFTKLMNVAFSNSFCARMPPNLMKAYCSMGKPPDRILPCCTVTCGKHCFQPSSITVFDETGCGRDALFLFLDGLLYFGILLFLETGLPGKAWEHLMSRIPRRKAVSSPVPVVTEIDSDVSYEMQRIENSDPRTASHEALVVVNLKKKFGGLQAVDGLSFSVHKQECFGLLGVNGAGKTSTFKMLCGDILPTEGTAFIDGFNLKTNLRKFQSFIGYCPQFDALIDLLTGREMLRLFAYIRGIPSRSVEQCVNNIIYGIDLQEHADKMTKLYSGGNKRKLSLGLALIGCPPLILLDEPTSGVDPVSRRKIWGILSHARAATGAAVVLCTHSMEECEALCSRLAIMVKGQFRCLGSIQQLKSKFGQGFTVVMKFKSKENIQSDVIDVVKNEFFKVFPSGRLNEYHQGVLNFHITDPSLPWSYLFESMEQLKEKFQLEDYFVSGTTLEQIFLAFAHEQ